MAFTHSCIRNNVKNYNDLVSAKSINVFENNITSEVLDTIINFLDVKESKSTKNNIYTLYVEKKINVINVYFSYGDFEIERYYLKRDDFKGYLNYSGKIFFIYGFPSYLFNSKKEIIKVNTKIPKDLISIYEPQSYILKIYDNKFEIKEPRY